MLRVALAVVSRCRFSPEVGRINTLIASITAPFFQPSANRSNRPVPACSASLKFNSSDCSPHQLFLLTFVGHFAVSNMKFVLLQSFCSSEPLRHENTVNISFLPPYLPLPCHLCPIYRLFLLNSKANRFLQYAPISSFIINYSRSYMVEASTWTLN